MNDKDDRIFGILFRACDSICSVPIQSITSIESLTECPTQIPHSPSHVLGMCRLHGKNVNIVDLGQLLELEHAHKELRQGIVILVNTRVGFWVEEILGAEPLYACQNTGLSLEPCIHNIYSCKSRNEIVLGLDIPYLLSLC